MPHFSRRNDNRNERVTRPSNGQRRTLQSPRERSEGYKPYVDPERAALLKEIMDCGIRMVSLGRHYSEATVRGFRNRFKQEKGPLPVQQETLLSTEDLRKVFLYRQEEKIYVEEGIHNA